MPWPFSSSSKGLPAETNAVPDVILDFEFEGGVLFIVVANIGNAPALDVSVTFDRELKGEDDSKPVNDLALFRKLLFMPPGKRVRTLLGGCGAYFGQGRPTEIEARISFRDRGGRRYKASIKHDLSVYRDIRHL